MKKHIQLSLLSFFFMLSLPAFAEIQLVRDQRIQSFLQKTVSPKDKFDSAINSPKSALFSEDGRKLYVNSLEGGQTVVYEWPTLKKLKVIDHYFGLKNQNLFLNNEETVFEYPYYKTNPKGANYFRGKPVEMTFSHGGNLLWVTYYRRDYDTSAQSPSAVAIIDTKTDTILRVMPTGPIPKFVAVSPDGRQVAITHWGDNTIGLIDITSSDVKEFRYTTQLVVEKKLSQEDKEGTDRDSTCGFCLRGTVFSPDSNYLIVARMGGGGLAAFDVHQEKYLGTLLNVRPTPRHLLVTPDQKKLVVSSNVSGYVTVFDIQVLIRDFLKANGRRLSGHGGREVNVGSGARTIELDPRGRYVYVAVNNDVKVVAVDLETSKVVAEVKVDPYPVGLAVSKDGEFIAVTSQGHAGSGGGNAVNIIKVSNDN